MSLPTDHENWDEFHDVDVVNWKRVRSALEHENLLVNHRLTWLLSSQAFLFAAFAIIFQESAKNDVDPNRRVLYQFILAGLSITGILVAFYMQRPIRTAEIQHDKLVEWWRNQKLRDSSGHPPICGEPSKLDLYFPQSNFPILFVIAWSAFGFVVIGNAIHQAISTYSEIIKLSLAVIGTSIGLVSIGVMIGRKQKPNG